MKYIGDEEHIVFKDKGKGRRKNEVYDGIDVIIAIPNKITTSK